MLWSRGMPASEKSWLVSTDGPCLSPWRHLGLENRGLQVHGGCMKSSEGRMNVSFPHAVLVRKKMAP